MHSMDYSPASAAKRPSQQIAIGSAPIRDLHCWRAGPPLDQPLGRPHQYAGEGAPALSEGKVVRKVEIVEEPNQKIYRWTAVDKKTNQSLLRLPDLSQMRDVCRRLEWKVVDVKSMPRLAAEVQALH
jgi:hypothetical protein